MFTDRLLTTPLLAVIIFVESPSHLSFDEARFGWDVHMLSGVKREVSMTRLATMVSKSGSYR